MGQAGYGEFGAGDETEQRAEAGGGGGADEVEAGEGGLEVAVEDGGAVFVAADAGKQRGREEAQAGEVYAEAGAGEDVGGEVFAGLVFGVGEGEADERLGLLNEIGGGDGPAAQDFDFAEDAAT